MPSTADLHIGTTVPRSKKPSIAQPGFTRGSWLGPTQIQTAVLSLGQQHVARPAAWLEEIAGWLHPPPNSPPQAHPKAGTIYNQASTARGLGRSSVGSGCGWSMHGSRGFLNQTLPPPEQAQTVHPLPGDAGGQPGATPTPHSRESRPGFQGPSPLKIGGGSPTPTPSLAIPTKFPAICAGISSRATHPPPPHRWGVFQITT